MVDTRGHKTKRLKGTPGIRTGEQAAYELLQDELSPTLGIKSFAVLFSTMFVTLILSAPKMNAALLKCYLAAQSVSVIEDPLYNYSVTPDSLTWSRITPVEETHRLIAYFEEALGERRSEPDAQKALKRRTSSCVS